MPDALDSLSSLVQLSGAQILMRAMNNSLDLMATGTCLSGASDPAELLDSVGTDPELAGIEAALASSSQAVNVADTAAAGLDQISNLLSQAQSLVSANGGNLLGAAQKSANQSQIDSILGSINHIATTTSFAGHNLLDGTGTISANGDSLNISAMTTDNLGQIEINGTNYNLSDLASGQALDTTGGGADAAADVLDQAIDQVTTQEEQIGTLVGENIQSSMGELLTQRSELVGSLLSVGDADNALEAAAIIRAEMAGSSSLFFISGFAKQQHLQTMVLSLLG